MGYDLERFVGEVNEGLLCSICRDVLEDPVLTPCEHAFCSGCIGRWLEEHQHCPEDRSVLDATQLRALFRYMKNDLDRLEIRCRNQPLGCEVICALESIHLHERQCDPALLSRTNTGVEYLCGRCGRGMSPGSREVHHCVCEHSQRAETSTSVSALRAELNALRAEMNGRVEELEFQVDLLKRYAVRRDNLRRREMDALKGYVCSMRSNLRILMLADRVRCNSQARAKALGSRVLF